MTAPRFESSARPQPTHTAWPATRQQITVPPVPRRVDPQVDERHEEEHTRDEPGYGHGV
ncbi:MAG TPA: hypothetical protein VKD69_05770 [Vicinamibacterales bacterium]|nr:hypothetical protein [Vicinamibacterales bacterium]